LARIDALRPASGVHTRLIAKPPSFTSASASILQGDLPTLHSSGGPEMLRTNNPSALALVLGLGAVLAIAACGGDDDDDDDDAKASASVGDKKVTAGVDAKSAQLALNELSSNVDTTITGFSALNPAAPGTPLGTVAPAINVSCDAGGAASVGGYVNIVPLPINVDVKVAIAYEGCVTRSGTTIQGELEFSQTVAVGPGTPRRIETLYTGDVTLRGAVNARCPVDLNVLVDEAGNAVEVGGTFCGRDASTLSLKIMPRWAGGSVEVAGP
jgi:hypothetical protein